MFISFVFKLERRRQDEKMQRDTAMEIYLELVEKQRNYYKTVKDFQEVQKSILHTLSLLIFIVYRNVGRMKHTLLS